MTVNLSSIEVRVFSASDLYGAPTPSYELDDGPHGRLDSQSPRPVCLPSLSFDPPRVRASKWFNSPESVDYPESEKSGSTGISTAFQRRHRLTSREALLEHVETALRSQGIRLPGLHSSRAQPSHFGDKGLAISSELINRNTQESRQCLLARRLVRTDEDITAVFQKLEHVWAKLNDDEIPASSPAFGETLKPKSGTFNGGLVAGTFSAVRPLLPSFDFRIGGMNEGEDVPALSVYIGTEISLERPLLPTYDPRFYLDPLSKEVLKIQMAEQRDLESADSVGEGIEGCLAGEREPSTVLTLVGRGLSSGPSPSLIPSSSPSPSSSTSLGFGLDFHGGRDVDGGGGEADRIWKLKESSRKETGGGSSRASRIAHLSGTAHARWLSRLDPAALARYLDEMIHGLTSSISEAFDTSMDKEIDNLW